MLDIRLATMLLACSALAACQFGGGGSGAERPPSGATTRPSGAAHAPHTIVGTGVNQTYDCAGGSVTVAGYENTVHFTGECPALAVTGYGNTITVEKAGSISVTGHTNTLTWHSGISGDPRIVNAGAGNTIQHETGGAEAGGSDGSGDSGVSSGGGSGGGRIVVDQDLTARTFVCSGKSVLVSGNTSRVTLTGRCATVTVSGDTNHVTIASAARLVVTGDDNVVQAGGNPQTTNTGDNNVIGH